MTSPPSKVMITGASGLLGSQVLKAFQRAGWVSIGTGLSRASPPEIIKLDLCNSSEIEEVLETTKPDVVVHCAAQRFPDKVDSDPDAARALNIEASRMLARAVALRGGFLIYISTDYVFPGLEGQAPYSSDDEPNPPNVYGQTKLDGETAILGEAVGSSVVLRVPVLYGPAKQNRDSAVNTLIDTVWKAQKEKVTVDDWSIRYPTNTEDVGRVCVDVAGLATSAKHGVQKKPLPKVLQFSSEDRFTKYEMCKLFAEILGISLAQMEANKRGNDPAAAVQRPYDCHLSTQALQDIGVDVRTQDFRGWW